MEYSIDELARALDCELLHGSDCIISGAGSPQQADRSRVVYAAKESAFAQAVAGQPGCIIVDRDYGDAAGAAVLLSSDPRRAFHRCLELFAPPFQPSCVQSPRAEIAADAVCGAGVTVEPFAVLAAGSRVGAGSYIGHRAVIGAGAVLGCDCRIHPGVVIEPGCVLGDRVEIHANAVIGADGFGFRSEDGRHCKIPQIGRVEIGDDVEIGAGATVDRATAGATCIGSGSKLDNLVHIGHNVVIGRNVLIAAQTGIAGSTVVGDGALFGGQVGVADHCQIGAGAVFGAQAGAIPGTFEPGKTYWGTPAREIGEVQRMIAWVRRMVRREQRQKRNRY